MICVIGFSYKKPIDNITISWYIISIKKVTRIKERKIYYD